MSTSRSINSATLIKILPRSKPGQLVPQVVSNATRAASRAFSTSASVPSTMAVIFSPLVGLMTLLHQLAPVTFIDR
jgi:hypothetical protein